MKEAITLFKRVYQQHQDVEICLVELKRKEFSQRQAVEVLLAVSEINRVRASEVVSNSLAWSS